MVGKWPNKGAQVGQEALAIKPALMCLAQHDVARTRGGLLSSGVAADCARRLFLARPDQTMASPFSSAWDVPA
eukprot:10728859-Lingulodinium_polyedra.AAC.1